MNEPLAMLIADPASPVSWGTFEYGVLMAVVSGLILLGAKLYSARKDREEEDEKKTLKTALDSANKRLDDERFERQSAIAEETSARRRDTASLGNDIVAIQNEMCHDYGKRNLPIPTFGRRSRGDD